MIKKLQHKDKNISSEIRRVFQVSYAVEAKLLGAIDFPPLKRKLEDFIESNNTFFGVFLNDALAGVIEIKKSKEMTENEKKEGENTSISAGKTQFLCGKPDFQQKNSHYNQLVTLFFQQPLYY